MGRVGGARPASYRAILITPFTDRRSGRTAPSKIFLSVTWAMFSVLGIPVQGAAARRMKMCLKMIGL